MSIINSSLKELNSMLFSVDRNSSFKEAFFTKDITSVFSFCSSNFSLSKVAVSNSFSTIWCSFFNCKFEIARYFFVFSLSSIALKVSMASNAVETVVIGVLNSCVMLLIKSFLISANCFCLLMIFNK